MLQRALHKFSWFRSLACDRIMVSPRTTHEVITAFNRLYCNSWHHLEKDTPNPSWMGGCTLKFPLDLLVYQETLFELKPDLVIETGTHFKTHPDTRDFRVEGEWAFACKQISAGARAFILQVRTETVYHKSALSHLSLRLKRRFGRGRQ